ncbi:MAG TPA: T9SS type A sorting domain-containing protein [Flavobacterium sp.]|jgi:hypothetical protein
MKNIFLSLFLISVSSILYSQNANRRIIGDDGNELNLCIIGNAQVTIGETNIFSSILTAQCSSCYDWDINNDSDSSDNQTVGIVGIDTEQTVQIQGITAGPFTLQLTYFDETGCHTCNFSGVVLEAPVVTPLPRVSCFGFDPVEGPPDVNEEGLLNYGYLGMPYQAPISSIGLTFAWYFKFANDNLLTFDTQNPTFRELCPTNPVKSFALVVSNGVQSRQYRSIDPDYPIPGFSMGSTPTCFIHPECGIGGFANSSKTVTNQGSIILSPNPTTSIIKFEGENLKDYKISVFNMNGEEILKNLKLDQDLNLENQKKGIYLYVITNEKGFKQEGKIIKE